MSLKFYLGLILGIVLVLPLGMAGEPEADSPSDKDALPCMGAASAESSDCCGKQHQRHAGHGKGHGAQAGERCGGCSEGMGSDARFQDDRDLFHFLLDHRSEISRKVKMLDDGVDTLTQSSNPEVAEKIREHVASMYLRIEEGQPIHMRDPLFAELFRHTDKIEMNVEPTKKGVRVIETSDDPAVAALIQAHADVITQFLENGYSEVHSNHAVPSRSVALDEDSSCPHRGRMARSE